MEDYAGLSDWELIKLNKQSETLNLFNILKKRHQSIIYKIAGKYFRTENIGHASKASAIKEGEVALLRAAIDYDPEKGVEFKNYAYLVIDGYILNYITKNKSLIITSAMQKRLSKLYQVISNPPFSEDQERSLLNIIEDDHKLIKNVLIQNYPEENWDKFFDETIEILKLSEISIDVSITDKDGNEMSSHEIIKSDIVDAHKAIENTEALRIFKEKYNRWMHEIISRIKFSQKNKEILKMYYIGGIDENILSVSLSSDYQSGYANLRKIKSRFKKKVCDDQIPLLDAMFAELNRYFDFSYIGSENALCEDFIDFCEALRKLGLLKE